MESNTSTGGLSEGANVMVLWINSSNDQSGTQPVIRSEWRAFLFPENGGRRTRTIHGQM